MCEMAANGKDRDWGRGGLATCVCNANEHGPPQLFLHCCAYMSTSECLCLGDRGRQVSRLQWRLSRV